MYPIDCVLNVCTGVTAKMVDKGGVIPVHRVLELVFFDMQQCGDCSLGVNDRPSAI